MWLAASLLASTAGVLAVTTQSSAQVTQPAPGVVIRDAGPITISENRGGRYVGASTSAANNAANPTSGCNGSVPTKPQASSTITVTRNSDDTEVFSASHVTPNISGLFGSHAAASNAEADWTTTWTDPTPGVYTIRSVNTDVAKANNNPATACTTAISPTTDVVFEYRPWQHANFNDVLGKGSVRMNSNPAELQFSVSGKSSPVVSPSGSSMTFFSSPVGLLSLPGDPGSCATDPLSCLPPSAVQCNPSAGCTPNLVVVNHGGGSSANQLLGIFDLETGAFAAFAKTGGKTRVLASAGTQVDAALQDILEQLAAAGLEQGIDLLTILNTKVEARLAGGGNGTITLGVLEGLELSVLGRPESTREGLSILSSFTLNAGFITHTVGPFCSVDATPVGRFLCTATIAPLSPDIPDALVEDDVFTVTPSPLVPPIPVPILPVPLPAPLNALGDTITLAGGPLVAVTGTYADGLGSHTAGSGLTGPSVDTAPDEPNGLPLWLPALDRGTMVRDVAPMQFIGHALLVDLPILADAASGLDLGLDLGHLLIGQGVSIWGDSPLTEGFESLPLLWDTENPAAAQLNELLGSLSPELLGNEAVGAVLGAALALAGGGSPDLDSITAALSDLGSFTELLEAVSGTGGLDAVPGLADLLGVLEAPLAGLLGLLNPVLGLLGGL